MFVKMRIVTVYIFIVIITLSPRSQYISHHILYDLSIFVWDSCTLSLAEPGSEFWGHIVSGAWTFNGVWGQSSWSGGPTPMKLKALLHLLNPRSWPICPKICFFRTTIFVVVWGYGPFGSPTASVLYNMSLSSSHCHYHWLIIIVVMLSGCLLMCSTTLLSSWRLSLHSLNNTFVSSSAWPESAKYVVSL